MSLPNPLPDTASSLFVRRLRLQAKIGDLGATDWNARKKTMLNEDPQAVQISTLDSLTPFSIGKVYSFVLLGFAVNYTTLAGDVDLAGVAIGIAAQVNANPDLRGQVTAAPSGNDVTITGNQPGAVFDLTAVAELSVTATQGATSASEIPFGRLVLSKGYSAVSHRAADELGRLADSNAFTAQADTITVTYEAGETYIVEIETDDGYRAVFAVPADTDDNTTAGDIEAAIDADLVLASKGITADVLGNVVTVNSANAGSGFQSSVGLAADAGVAVITLVSAYGIDTSLNAAAAGISMQTYDDEQSVRGGDTVAYRPNEPVKVLTSGLIWVELDSADTAPTLGGSVYVDLTPGATAGRFYTTAAAGRSLLVGATWERGANNGVDLIGLVNLAA